jgi:hypothetical protein
MAPTPASQNRPKRTQLRLFIMYLLTFMLSLGVTVAVLMQVSEDVRAGQTLLLLLPPLAGIALFHGLFPLVSRIRLGLEFTAVGGGLVYGLGILLTYVAWQGFLDPGTALVMWLAGVFGPGWWLILSRAEKYGYFA